MDINSQLDELFDPKIEVIDEPKPTQKPIQEDFEIEGLDELFGIKSEEEIIVEEVIPEPIKEEASYKPIDLNAYVTDDFVDLLIEASRKGEVELVELKEEVAPEPEIESEPIKPRTLMDDYSDTLGAISKKLKVEELVTEEDRLTSLETQLIQVRQLFREATMVSGIGQGGDGQTPGSGVVKAKDLDDVSLDGIQLGDQLVWDGNQFVPGSGDGARPPIIGELPPTEHPDFIGPDNDLKEGDHWIDDNGSLHIYYDGQWNMVTVYSHQVLPSIDAPYNINTPNGQTFNNQKEYNEWLYTRTDRKPIISSTAPSIHPDFPADPLRMGDFWIDDNSHLYYWENNAWLPVSGGAGRPPIFSDEEPTEHPDFNPPDNELQTGDTWYDTDNSFKASIYDGTQWVSVTPDRKETFARFYQYVEASTFNSGNDNTCTFVATGSTIDTITNVKFSINDQQGKIRYLYKINEDILIEDERNGAYAALRVIKINGDGDYDVELEHKNGFGGLDIGHTYAFGSTADHGAIPDIGEDSQQPGTLDDRYVNTSGGDKMEGPLQITGDRSSNGDGIESTIKTLNVDSGQNSSLQLKHNGTSKVYVGNNQTSFQHHIKFAQTGKQVYAGNDNDKNGLAFYADGVLYVGEYREDQHVATKKNVDEAIFDDINDDTTHKFVKRSGDSMTGSLQITHAAGLDMQGASPVRTRHIDSGNNSNLEIKRNGQRRILVGTNELVFDKIAKYVSDVAVTDNKHLVTKKYVDEAIFGDINDDTTHKFVKRSGDTMSGPLNFKENAYIDGRNTSTLDGRAGLEIRASGERPIAISNSGSYQETLSIYKYDGSAVGGRSKTLSIYASGNLFSPGNITFDGTANFNTTNIAGTTNIDANLTVTGNATLNDGVDVTGATTINGNLTSNGTANLKTTNIDGTTTISGNHLMVKNSNAVTIFRVNPNNAVANISGSFTANELKSTVLNSGQDSNLSIQRNGETKILVGANIIQMQKQVKLLQEGTDNDHAVTKAYVDNKVGSIDIQYKITQSNGNYFIEGVT